MNRLNTVTPAKLPPFSLSTSRSTLLDDDSVDRGLQCVDRAGNYIYVCLPRIHCLPALATSHVLPHPLPASAQVVIIIINYVITQPKIYIY